MTVIVSRNMRNKKMFLHLRNLINLAHAVTEKMYLDVSQKGLL